MDPERRILKQIMISEAEESDHVFSMLMGDEVLQEKSLLLHTQKWLI